MAAPASLPKTYQLPAQDILTAYLKNNTREAFVYITDKDPLIEKIAKNFAKQIRHEKGMHQELLTLLKDEKFDLPDSTLLVIAINITSAIKVCAEDKKAELKKEEGKSVSTAKLDQKNSQSPESGNGPIINDSSIAVALDSPKG